jgi:DNA-directed RNA polymerase subunit M/transcription elongation factor TFIIS
MCRGLLMLKEENGKNIGICKCGFKRTAGISISGEEKNSINSLITIGTGVAIDNNISTIGFFKVCEKCGFDKAEAFQITSNESEITIFKCLRCGKSIRQSQGSSKA